MAYQALYRIYRPRSFSEVQGQDRIVATLREAVHQGRLTHAYLFSGPRGTGKTSVARILAKAVNCEQRCENGDPCLKCPSCQSIERGQHLDVIEIDAASNRGIDEIRDIKERITHQTAVSRYKVYIIDEAHMLTTEAFNAFLKTLEEPPAHVLFILATTEAHKLPVTVLSRCQRYEFKRLTIPVIQARLQFVAEQEGIAVEPEALELVAQAADGAMRDALSLFDQVVAVATHAVTVDDVARQAGMIGQRQMAELVAALAHGVDDVIQVLGDLRIQGLDEKLILRDLARLMRDVMLYRSAGPQLFSEYRREGLEQVVTLLPKNIDTNGWIDAIDQLAQAEARLRGGFPPDLAVELACLKLQRNLWAEAPVRPEAVPQFVEPSPSRSPETIVSEQPPQTRDFQAVLDIIKRDRPSTHALFDKATGTVDANNTLTIFFEFPAHRQLMDQPHNRDVVDRAVKAVFGPEAQYRFVDGTAPNGRLSEDSTVSPTALKAAIKEWFGPNVELTGID
ncbi:MAG: DNA polymerase III subunit gamma/tau [Sulfobacillus acidophilus]|uniref:DNA-directed DNA polymerase n=1 Tax=Sulfobacillus acidophilus TaxID=53633 RepID=A0A2T2WK81_9FIRM|nr:MAG: DNA polymerase III subunit gamma/tau [Sulfobacillus acidophilus]